MKRKPYIQFLPFLFIYTFFFIKFLNVDLILDEGRYWKYAENITQGFYADRNDHYGYLWNGPGYPIFLSFFQFLKLPFNAAKAFNILFLYIGLVYFHKTLLNFLSKKKATIITVFFGLQYPLIHECLFRLQVESLTIMLVSLIAYSSLKYYKTRKTPILIFTACLIGYLILTKIFFSVIFICLLGILCLIILFPKLKKDYTPFLRITFFGLLFTIPYLMYTFYLSGKPFYYSNAGGLSLYWMSTPYEEELGDWHYYRALPDSHFIKQNHQDFFNSINDLSPVERDQALKKQAYENILNNKMKYAKNLVLNLSRLFIIWPTSTLDTSLLIHLAYFFPHLIIFVCLVIAFILTILNISRVPPIIIYMGILSILYIGLTLLFSAFTRFLYPIFPVLFIWISYTLSYSSKVAMPIASKQNIE